MEFSTAFTRQDLDDLAMLVHPRFYWARVLLADIRGVAILLTLIWVGVRGILGRSDLAWWGVAGVWTVLFGVFGWAYYSALGERAKTLASLNASLPDRTTFTADGVRWTRSSGASGFLPWNHFTAFREHGGVLSLDESKRTVGVFVSVRHLSDIERHQLRDFLRSNIPPSRAM